MKFAISKGQIKPAQELQQMFDVTLISDKGLVFLHRDDWERIQQMLDECSEILGHSHMHNTLSDTFCFWSECFIVAYDESEDYSCHAICNFELFSLCCRRCDIYPVLLPMWDLISYIARFNAHHNNNALGCYIESRGDILIDVEDN